MAIKKSIETMQITFRCPKDVAQGLKDLAFLSRCDTTELLVELCKSIVSANKERIKKFRQQAGQPIKMPSFDTSKKADVDLSDEEEA